MLYSLALSTNWQYVRNAFANLLWDFNCDLTRTALLQMIALLLETQMSTLMNQYVKDLCLFSSQTIEMYITKMIGN